eukprot:262475-Chlamydomonas_euryale.AAC.1
MTWGLPHSQWSLPTANGRSPDRLPTSAGERARRCEITALQHIAQRSDRRRHTTDVQAGRRA